VTISNQLCVSFFKNKKRYAIVVKKVYDKIRIITQPTFLIFFFTFHFRERIQTYILYWQVCVISPLASNVTTSTQWLWTSVNCLCWKIFNLAFFWIVLKDGEIFLLCVTNCMFICWPWIAIVVATRRVWLVDMEEENDKAYFCFNMYSVYLFLKRVYHFSVAWHIKIVND